VGVPECTISITIEPPDGGTVSVSPQAKTYPQGMNVTLKAIPAAGYEFDHWSGDVSDSSPTTSLNMAEEETKVTAHFK
jgi:hypothetical protein